MSESGTTRPAFFVGLDLGQQRDYTAIAVAEQFKPDHPDPYTDPPARYDVSYLERMQAPYPDVVSRVSELLWTIHRTHTVSRPAYLQRYYPDIEPKVFLVIDGTGVGVAVVDLFRKIDLPGEMVAVTITGGDAMTREGDTARVPKRDLAGVVQVLLQGSRLRIAQALPLAPVLQQELLNFRVKISLTGHDSYGAGADWRSANHDDLVLAVALALWAGENRLGQGWEHLDAQTLAALFGMGL